MSQLLESRITITPLDAPIGAEISGVDLSKEQSSEVMKMIDEAYNKYNLLLFRNQKLTPEQHIRFGASLGPLEIHVLKRYLLKDYPEILLISNILREDGDFLGLPDAGQTWHTDTSYRQKPSRGSILYALEIPRDENQQPLGDTLFASTAAAYDDLSPDLKELLNGKKAIHRYSLRKRPSDSKREKLTKAQLDETPDIAHPVVRTHPYTGRKALYVFEGECIGIEGMPEEYGAQLISDLTQHIISPQYTYRHKWNEGDVIMWDNAASLHLAICDYKLPQRRLLHRVTIEGGVPF